MCPHLTAAALAVSSELAMLGTPDPREKAAAMNSSRSWAAILDKRGSPLGWPGPVESLEELSASVLWDRVYIHSGMAGCQAQFNNLIECESMTFVQYDLTSGRSTSSQLAPICSATKTKYLSTMMISCSIDLSACNYKVYQYTIALPSRECSTRDVKRPQERVHLAHGIFLKWKIAW